MVRVKVMLSAAALAIAASVVAAGPAVAAKGGNATAQACQKGGWTLGTFANQGDCVNDGAQATTVTFNWTGVAQTWTVPDGVTKATFDLYGAEGGLVERKSSGGKGGRATATIPVTGGSSVQVTVGGQGQSDGNPAYGGFNGGGDGHLGGGGGGASDIRIGGTDLANRVLVAGGGGGGGNCGVTRGGSQTDGGDGGGTSGDDAFTSRLCAEEGIVGGGGGTQDAGGTALPGDPGSSGRGWKQRRRVWRRWRRWWLVRRRRRLRWGCWRRRFRPRTPGHRVRDRCSQGQRPDHRHLHHQRLVGPNNTSSASSPLPKDADGRTAGERSTPTPLSRIHSEPFSGPTDCPLPRSVSSGYRGEMVRLGDPARAGARATFPNHVSTRGERKAVAPLRTRENPADAGPFQKPSVGLEPTTPSLPWTARTRNSALPRLRGRVIRLQITRNGLRVGERRSAAVAWLLDAHWTRCGASNDQRASRSRQ